VISKLRIALGKALKSVRRVAVLVDNLDKAWDRRSDLPTLAEFLLALLGSASRVQTDFGRADSRRDRVDISLAIFLRSDIFSELMDVVREPDKMKYVKLAWNDTEMLLRVIEERFSGPTSGGIVPSEMWRRYFCPTVSGVETRTDLVAQILPRPRDLLYLTKAAIATAVNRGHTKVEESDILEARKQYSQYALDSILVEEDVNSAPLEEVLYEFIGSSARLSELELERVLSQAKVSIDQRDGMIDQLCCLSFLGVETSDGEFRFANDPQEHRKNLVLARRLAKDRGQGITFMLNRPFRPFLETHDAQAKSANLPFRPRD
jgi:hypothetical protein